MGFSHLITHVTIEPTMFFTYFTHEVFSALNQNLYLHKFCRNDSWSSAPDPNTPCDNENRGQSNMLTIYNNVTLPGLFLSLVISVYASYYSDKVGKKRKIFMVIAMTAMVLRTLFAVLQTVFWHWSPVLGIVVNVFLSDIGGGLLSLATFIRAYVFDTTSNENRLSRVTALNALQSVAVFTGKASSGYLLQKCGFLVSFVVCLALQLAALISTLVFVQEKATTPSSTRVTGSEMYSTMQIIQMFKLILFSKESMKILTSIWFLLFICMLIIFTSSGESSVFYLYTRDRFHWDAQQFSLFDSVRVLSPVIGNFLCCVVLIKFLEIHDCIIGVFATFCDTLAVVGYYYTVEKWQMFVVPLFDMFQGVAGLISTTLVSQFFTEKEYGRMNLVIIVLSVVSSMCGTFIYSLLYKETLSWYPNAFFLLSIFVNAVSCVLYGACFLMLR